MTEPSRVWLGRDGELYEVRLRQLSGESSVLTLRQLPSGPIWRIAADPGVSLIGADTGELEAWLQVAKGER